MRLLPPKTTQTRDEVAKEYAKSLKRRIIPAGMQAEGAGMIHRVEKPKDRFTPIKHRPNRDLSRHE